MKNPSFGDVTVLLVDDHAMFREGLRLVIEAQQGVRVVGEAGDGREALEMVEKIHPQVVVMDIAMPNLNGLDATRQIRRRFPDVQVVILTMHERRQYLTQILQAGAIGCVLKRSAGIELLSAIKAAARRETYFSPSIANVLVDDYRRHLMEGDGADPLTEREREIVQLIAEGKPNADIAKFLGLSVHTVTTHRANIMRKTDSGNAVDLVKYAMRMGMINAE